MLSFMIVSTWCPETWEQRFFPIFPPNLPLPQFLCKYNPYPPAMRETWAPSWVEKMPWRRERYSLQYTGLENTMNCRVHVITNSQKLLSKRLSLSLHSTSYHSVYADFLGSQVSNPRPTVKLFAFWSRYYKNANTFTMHFDLDELP